MLNLKRLLVKILNQSTIREETLTFSYGGKSVDIHFQTSGNVLSVSMSKNDASMTLPTRWTQVGRLPSIRLASDKFIPMVSSNGLTFVIQVWQDGGVTILGHSSNAYWLQTSGTVIYK